MTDEDEDAFQKAIKCHICDIKYTEKEIGVRDHCHITGKFRGSAHQDCNLKLKINPDTIKIPVIFHNLRGYDSHFIMQQIGKISKEHKGKKYKWILMLLLTIWRNIWLSCLAIIWYF